MKEKMKNIRIMQRRSSIGILPKHKFTLIGLGLRNIGHIVIRKDTCAIRGMVRMVSHLVKIL
ncbi:MAG: 50S ribosomal subunit protein L30 [Candidatus Westeberhardia cardiocondylae]|nr:50S ribosomal subunit protein L30 [Candidatus Westeberhardia cardiocondylae]